MVTLGWVLFSTSLDVNSFVKLLTLDMIDKLRHTVLNETTLELAKIGT